MKNYIWPKQSNRLFCVLVVLLLLQNFTTSSKIFLFSKQVQQILINLGDAEMVVYNFYATETATRCVLYKNKLFFKFRNIHRKTSVLQSFIGVLKVCNFLKKRLQHRCFSVNIQKFLRAFILKSSCE